MIQGELIRSPITVTLVASPSGDLKSMYCMTCREKVCEYTGELYSVGPGVPPVQPYTAKKCNNSKCQAIYCIIGIVSMSQIYIDKYIKFKLGM